MNLIIDVGNSFVKLAVFEEGMLKHKEVVRLNFVLEGINILKEKYISIKKAIISSVGKLNKGDIKAISKSFDVMILDANIKLPFKNLYATPNTLGVDRIALVCASVEQFSNNNVLIIDAGTCITYDFVTAKNEYIGGAISPGLRMRYKSLNNLTVNLPLLESEIPKSITGNSTNESIHSGVVFGILKEIEGIIDEYRRKYSDLTVILTGGDTNFLSKQLKSSIFANSNFLLEGLNFILQFNLNE
ncbi:type III pantothenate kinase [Flavivirga sp. 57AJ16]|uniref:type III pantothenate kinase n=1 Tax=Flavivirga sp. 57AJ16 TaxID=3025307 RepID=UPI0023671C8E|nr:type III pantothenate kinase [Flavivirga sp. 57AJ16]MDD7886539.1 type III pantothenate kinase [Flavivirga sp. 57AJ16]